MNRLAGQASGMVHAPAFDERSTDEEATVFAGLLGPVREAQMEAEAQVVSGRGDLPQNVVVLLPGLPKLQVARAHFVGVALCAEACGREQPEGQQACHDASSSPGPTGHSISTW